MGLQFVFNTCNSKEVHTTILIFQVIYYFSHSFFASAQFGLRSLKIFQEKFTLLLSEDFLGEN